MGEERATHHPELAGRIALVTGANHGIGAATGRVLAREGAAVLLTFLRLSGEPDVGTPERYRRQRAADAEAVLDGIRRAGGRAEAVEADLGDVGVAGRLFDRAEAAFGPVEILVNNASGWLADSFKPVDTDRLGRRLRPVTADSHDRQFAVDARAAALLIAEFARRHTGRGGRWGRIVGLTSGGAHGFPEEVSYGAAKAAQESYTMSAAAELAPYGVTANVVHPPVTDTGWITPEVEAVVRRDPGLSGVARPDEVAGVIAFLASNRARLVSGNVIRLR